VSRTCARLAGAVGVALAALALGGCGFIVGSAPTTVEQLVTRDFGATVLHRSGVLHASSGETALSLLGSSYPIVAREGGDGVQSIAGLVGGQQAAESGGAAEWIYYVNGVQATKGPAKTNVLPGDHIWWDLHYAGQSEASAAVVGSFPEPFVNGFEGRRLPVRVECTPESQDACQAVTARLRSFGVVAAVAAVGSGGAPETLRVIVGIWARIGGELATQTISSGPRASGVYARFSATGQALTLLDAQAAPVRTLHGDAGLVAATRGVKEAPVWVITGTDVAGVDLAAHAFNRATLEDHFAVALEAGGAIALPASPTL
jgi:hypothetical protein